MKQNSQWNGCLVTAPSLRQTVDIILIVCVVFNNRLFVIAVLYKGTVDVFEFFCVLII